MPAETPNNKRVAARFAGSRWPSYEESKDLPVLVVTMRVCCCGLWQMAWLVASCSPVSNSSVPGLHWLD